MEDFADKISGINILQAETPRKSLKIEIFARKIKIKSAKSATVVPTTITSVTAPYIGRLAPSPTGLLHLGHAATFWAAHERAQQHSGTLLLRNEDLDPQRSRAQYA